MSNFISAYNRTSKHEGGFVNDPDDPGKMTYCGISRRFHKNWEGWKLVDAWIKGKPYNQIFNKKSNNPDLKQMVKTFYYTKFWEPIKLDRINNKNLAFFIYDWNVNPLGPTVRNIQEATNQFAKSKILLVDGQMGPNTRTAINMNYDKSGYTYINYLVWVRVKKYFESSTENPIKYKFLFGWVSRAISYLEKP